MDLTESGNEVQREKELWHDQKTKNDAFPATEESPFQEDGLLTVDPAEADFPPPWIATEYRSTSTRTSGTSWGAWLPGAKQLSILTRVKSQDWVSVLAVQLLIVTLLLRMFWLVRPEGALVFDEAYYVNAARVILGWDVPEGSPYHNAQPGLDPNNEHLPLAKLMIAGSMRMLGDNAFGWRMPSVVFGTIAVGVLFLLVLRMTRRPWLALFAAFIFTFDNLVFVHGRIATLDIFMVTFMLLGVYWYAGKHPALAGAAIALSTLCKFNGIYAMGAVVGFEVLRFALQPERRLRFVHASSDLLLFFGSFMVVFLAILWPLDRFSGYDNPIDHVTHVYQYGMSLRRDSGPQGIESLPWQWLLNEVQIPYYRQDVNVSVDGRVVSSRAQVFFAGEMNPFVIFLLPMALAYLIYAVVRKRQDFPMMMLALMMANYLPTLAASLLVHRISYIFYFLPVLPALAAGIAYLFMDIKMPLSLRLAYAASVFAGFAALFPFRTVL